MNSILILAVNWQELTGWLALLNFVLIGLTLFSILSLKKDPVAANAWCMTVLFLPFGGLILYWTFGYQSVHRPLKRKRRHAESYRKRQAFAGETGTVAAEPDSGWDELARLGVKLGASPLLGGNRVELFHEGRPAFDAMLQAIREAKHHVHMEFFIVRADELGWQFMEALAERARAGVQVRFLYDAVGSWSLRRRALRPFTGEGFRCEPFLSLSLLRRRIQINLRNHRKIVVVDGRTAFTGGFNIGDEYLGKNAFFGPWRDTFLKIEGPAVRWMQRVFIEDWSFATQEDLVGPEYYPRPSSTGDVSAQIAWSGPDQELKTIREIYFAAIAKAKERLWIATPYFVPDAALLDALCLTARLGRNVRLLCPFRPDKWLPFLAARFYWKAALAAGVKIYQYTPGFLHAKLLIADDDWASVGSANFDNRSLHLNFEMTCLMKSKAIVAELEKAYLHDLESSIRVESAEFEKRGFVGRISENACRLMSPVL